MRNRKNIIEVELNMNAESVKKIEKIIEIVGEQTKKYPHTKIKIIIA